jgi:hypothetical protein
VQQQSAFSYEELAPAAVAVFRILAPARNAMQADLLQMALPQLVAGRCRAAALARWLSADAPPPGSDAAESPTRAQQARLLRSPDAVDGGRVEDAAAV